MRPTWRLLGALVLGAVIYLYGATSEVAWLFLFGLLLWAAALAMLGYTRWNSRGVAASIRLLAVESSPHSPSPDLPESAFRDAPLPAPVFEGDTVELELALTVTGGSARGPARLATDIGGRQLAAGSGLVPAAGWRRVERLEPVRRGSLAASGVALDTGDPLGFFRHRRRSADQRLAVVLPLFSSLATSVQVRELESAFTAVRPGHGNDLYGVREYRAGDPLRRIHWRTSARRGELVVREFEPPGLRIVGLLLDPTPATPEAADQVARLAASEAWDCLRSGGRVVAWCPGREATRLDESRSLWSILEWLALYPDLPVDPSGPPRVMDAIAFLTRPGGPALDALQDMQSRGAGARAWLVGEGELEVPYQAVGTEWPL